MHPTFIGIKHYPLPYPNQNYPNKPPDPTPNLKPTLTPTLKPRRNRQKGLCEDPPKCPQFVIRMSILGLSIWQVQAHTHKPGNTTNVAL